MKQTITVRALVKKDQKTLLVRRSVQVAKGQGLFELPGGKLDFGESPESALAREVREELGCDLQVAQLYSVCSIVDPAAPDEHHIVIVFMASIRSVERSIQLSSEHDKYEWIKLSDMQQKSITHITSKVLKLQNESFIKESEVLGSPEYVDNISTDHAQEVIIVYADGGSRGNPGPSAAGFVVMDKDENLLFEGGDYIGITTNNQAEYHAMKLGLEKALELGAKRVYLRMDSLLVINQMSGLYQIRNRDLWPVYQVIKDLTRRFDKVTFTHIRREFNREADALVNRILDEHA